MKPNLDVSAGGTNVSESKGGVSVRAKVRVEVRVRV